MKKQKFLDIQNTSKQNKFAASAPERFRATLFSRGKKTDRFYTEDSRLYVTPREFSLLQKGFKLDRETRKWDALSSRIARDFIKYQPSRRSSLLEILEKHQSKFNDSLAEVSGNLSSHFSLVRLWNLSIVGSVLFGMVMMTFVYRYLGQGAAADQIVAGQIGSQQLSSDQGKVLGNETVNNGEDFTKRVMEIEQANDEQALEKEIRKMVKGYPIETMVPYIAKKDRTVAAFLVGIAKKESGWGDRHPILNGQDCYNYWGYRGQRKLMGSGGHTCFNSPKDAVDTVAKRIEFLVSQEKLNTPDKMIIWKCGGACEVKNNPEEQKWISDVTMYFNKLNSD